MTSTVESTQRSSFAAACHLLDEALSGAVRREIVDEVAAAKDLGQALRRLRGSFQSHLFRRGTGSINLASAIKRHDSRTRADGFHVMNDWDGLADHVNEEIIPVDVLNYLIEKRGTDPADPRVLHILLDYYFLHVLALLSVRVWDDGRGDANLDRLNQLVHALQGPGGSGQLFAANAETLILIATSHFELHERGYGSLLAKVLTLDHAHQTNIALAHAASMGSHLRFGFEATYARDTVAMRDDNVADYPWLCFALLTAIREYERLCEEGIAGLERDRVIEALLDGLSADARAFVGAPPSSLAASRAERAEFAECFQRHRADILVESERFRPAADRYSPISFFFNFSHNVLKGTVIDALLRGEPWRLTFNDLLTGLPADPSLDESRQTLARTLMGYARSNPNRIRGRLMPVIVYDPDAGSRAFTVMIGKLREQGGNHEATEE
jgi:hypothetical protein